MRSAGRNAPWLGVWVWSLAIRALGGEPPPSELSPLEDDLQQVGERLLDEREVLGHLEAESSSLLQILGDMDEVFANADKAYQEVRSGYLEAENRLRSLEAERDSFDRRRSDLEQRLRNRLRSLYKQGDRGWLAFLFGSEGGGDALWRLRFLGFQARADRRLVAELHSMRHEVEAAEQSVKRERQGIASRLPSLRERREKALQALLERRKALQWVREKKGLQQRVIQELERSRARLQKILTTIEKNDLGGQGFVSWKGRLPTPVEGARLETSFGRQLDPTFKTVTLTQGVDLRAERGTPVLAVYPGRVAFAEAFQGYGLLVILEHGGGYFTLYGHLGTFAVQKGTKVMAGQPVGTLGETGSLKGPYLYFELRQGGQAVDPEQWMRF